MNGDEDALTPGEDRRISSEALARGDLTHALHHLAGALVGDPVDPQSLRLLDLWCEAAGDGAFELLPGDTDGATFGTAAVRAHLLHRTGQLEEALKLIFRVTLAVPQVPFSAWAFDWLEAPCAAPQLTAALGSQMFSSVYHGFPGEPLADPIQREAVERALELAGAVARLRPDDHHLLYCHALCCRKLGMYDDALEYALKAFAAKAEYLTAVGVATAYRARGNVAEALEYYGKAREHEPGDNQCLLDMGDICLQDNRLREAGGYYESVLAHEPDHAWALPSVLFIRSVLDNDLDAGAQLERLAREDPENERATVLSDALSPWVSFLPRPRDATVNVARKLAEKLDQGGSSPFTLRLQLSHVEAPSSILSLERLFRCRGLELGLELEVETIVEPDPRADKGEVWHRLWEYRGVEAVPAVAAPAADIADRVGELARQPFHIRPWSEQAAELGASLAGRGDEAVESLLGCMVHPPPDPEDLEPWEWVRLVQHAAAFTLAALRPARESGWSGSRRQRALLSVIRGPSDWTTEAAIVALVSLAEQEPEVRVDALLALEQLNDALPAEGGCCYEYALACCGLRFPDLPDELREELERRKLSLEEEDRQPLPRFLRGASLFRRLLAWLQSLVYRSASS